MHLPNSLSVIKGKVPILSLSWHQQGEPVAGVSGAGALGSLVCLVLLPPSSVETSAAPGPPEAGQRPIWPDLAHGQLISWGPGTSPVHSAQEEAAEDGVGPVEALWSELFSHRV